MTAAEDNSLRLLLMVVLVMLGPCRRMNCPSTRLVVLAMVRVF